MEVSELIPLLKNIAVGSLGLLGSIWLNVSLLRRITIIYEVDARINLRKKRYNRVFLDYYIAVVLLMLVQILAIVLWALAIKGLNLINGLLDAILFAGSCYTTIDIVPNVMPQDWKLLSIFIALCGLFSLALTTTSMLNMAVTFRLAWLHKHGHHIQRTLDKAEISVPELAALINPDKHHLIGTQDLDHQ